MRSPMQKPTPEAERFERSAKALFSVPRAELELQRKKYETHKKQKPKRAKRPR